MEARELSSKHAKGTCEKAKKHHSHGLIRTLVGSKQGQRSTKTEGNDNGLHISDNNFSGKYQASSKQENDLGKETVGGR